eukprot:CAMPEP_0204877106 /NCGR_PEP_ID=MMETSP1348-20121228/48010_1 /ASSEMBLY_ACC=CAM_ASM_000700 /TAXON_ID=215587 /ORGANISM="Aplanochytrium stocchinoi, Strain GSBS06" /LENGTH=433 /DNA_ID=CAMNT_0052033943 /DNA_START=6 /DNA_END=1307 /DNA_ORIENTATION=+
MSALTPDSPSINAELKQYKFQLIQKAKAQKFKKGNVSQTFIDSKRTWAKFVSAKQQNKWDTAFYLLHIYLRLVLEFNLHRRQEKDYQKVSAEALKNLRVLENELGICLNNIRYQILAKQKAEDAKLKEHERAEKEKERKEAERIRLLEEEEERLRADERKKAFQEGTVASEDAPILDAAAGAAALPNVPAPSAPAAGEASPYPDIHKIDLGPSRNLDVSAPPEPPLGPPPAYPGKHPLPAYPSPGNAQVPSPADTETLGSVTRNRIIDSVSKEEPFRKPKAFAIHRVKGDGNCAFRSLVQGMNNGRLDATAEYAKAMSLRKLVTKELLGAKNMEMMETGLTVEQVITMDPQSKFSSFGDYLRAMSQRSYAGEVEFWIIANALNIRIAVWQPEGTSFRHLVTYGRGKADPVHLLWQKSSYGEAGNHYDLLLTKL